VQGRLSRASATTATGQAPPHRFGPLSTAPLGRTFFAVPVTVACMVAAALEPAVAAGSVLAWAWAVHGQLSQAHVVLAMVVLALSFPGRQRSDMPTSSAWGEVSATWLARGAVLWAGLWISNALSAMDPRALAGAWVSTVALTGLAAQASGPLTRWWRRRPAQRRRAVVVGAGPLASRVTQALRQQSDQGVDLLGCFDDRLDQRLDPGARRMRQGDLTEVVQFIRQHAIHDVYITLPLGASERAPGHAGLHPMERPSVHEEGIYRAARVQQLLHALQDTTVSVHYVPDLLGISIIQGRLRDVNGVPVVGLCETPFTGVNQLIKRAEDLVLSSVIVAMISPLLLAVALGVKLSSPGPVLFRQRRNGLDGREIMVWKFRSMRTQDNGPVVRQATRGDPRITPFGAFIRRTSLDELPQFFNVLQGTMSIVGPRPHAVAHNDEYRELVQAYMVRHKVKPGITGWAQVNGHRGETDTLDKMRARVEYDLEYLRHWSLGLDLRIIARTVGLVLGDRHAY